MSTNYANDLAKKIVAVVQAMDATDDDAIVRTIAKLIDEACPINQAARDLPEFWQVGIYIENCGHHIELIDDDGDIRDFPTNTSIGRTKLRTQ